MSGIQGFGYYSNQAPVIGKNQTFYPASAPSPIQNALPNKIRSTRPEWAPTVKIAEAATLKVFTVDKQNLGSCTLIAKDLIKMSYHQISGIPIQNIQFKIPGYNNIPPFKVKEIVEFDSLQDYVILSIHKNSNNIYPANPEYLPKISRDRTSQEVLLAHVPNIDLQMSLASIAETPGCSLDLFSQTASMNYSCGGDNYTLNGEIISMHTASATGMYMGVKDESKTVFMADIMSIHKESILHDLYKDPSRKFKETPLKGNSISLLPVVETDEIYYTLERKGVSPKSVAETNCFVVGEMLPSGYYKEGFMERHYANCKDAANKIGSNHSKDPKLTVIKFSSLGNLEHAKIIIKEKGSGWTKIYPSHAWNYKYGKLINDHSWPIVRIKVSEKKAYHLDWAKDQYPIEQARYEKKSQELTRILNKN